MEGNRVHQCRIYAGELVSGRNGPGGQLDEVGHLPDGEAETTAPQLDNQDGALVAGPGRPGEEGMGVGDRQETAANVDKAVYGLGRAGNPGGREPGKHFAHPRGRRGAHQIPDPEDHDREGVSITHVV
ncbi:MAG TPA: hypothetical protein VFK09_09710 [Gemmatimonadales bacterium]|nr:hypothetical protein [Gemmatimonadales bacterium]